MSTGVTQGYNRLQISLHWLTAGLVLIIFFTGESMTDAVRSADRSGFQSAIAFHLVFGAAIFAVLAWRLVLRHSVGAPPPPPSEPLALRWLAALVHAGLYLDLLASAVVGTIAYLWVPSLGGLHEFLSRPVLMILFALHVAGAVWHQVVWGDDVFARMLRAVRN